MDDQGLQNFMVVEGFGNFDAGLENCDSVKVVKYFGSEDQAVEFAAEYYEEQIWGEDADGFSMMDDARMSFFVLVRETALLLI
jgi:hypothetical protein